MIPEIGVGRGVSRCRVGKHSLQRSQQPLRELYFRDEIHYGRVIFSGLTH
jgi:hypothetical protein